MADESRLRSRRPGFRVSWGVAELAKRRTVNPKTAGSNPAAPVDSTTSSGILAPFRQRFSGIPADCSLAHPHRHAITRSTASVSARWAHDCSTLRLFHALVTGSYHRETGAAHLSNRHPDKKSRRGMYLTVFRKLHSLGGVYVRSASWNRTARPASRVRIARPAAGGCARGA